MSLLYCSNAGPFSYNAKSHSSGDYVNIPAADTPVTVDATLTGVPFCIISPGLTGVPGTVSLRDATNEARYMYVKRVGALLNPIEIESVANIPPESAVFILHPDLFFPGFVAIESAMVFNHFIRNPRFLNDNWFVLWSGDNQDAEYEDEVSWQFIPSKILPRYFS